jgi:hypothetical protein
MTEAVSTSEKSVNFYQTTRPQHPTRQSSPLHKMLYRKSTSRIWLTRKPQKHCEAGGRLQEHGQPHNGNLRVQMFSLQETQALFPVIRRQV